MISITNGLSSVAFAAGSGIKRVATSIGSFFGGKISQVDTSQEALAIKEATNKSPIADTLRCFYLNHMASSETKAAFIKATEATQNTVTAVHYGDIAKNILKLPTITESARSAATEAIANSDKAIDALVAARNPQKKDDPIKIKKQNQLAAYYKEETKKLTLQAIHIQGMASNLKEERSTALAYGKRIETLTNLALSASGNEIKKALDDTLTARNNFKTIRKTSRLLPESTLDTSSIMGINKIVLSKPEFAKKLVGFLETENARLEKDPQATELEKNKAKADLIQWQIWTNTEASASMQKAIAQFQQG